MNEHLIEQLHSSVAGDLRDIMSFMNDYIYHVNEDAQETGNIFDMSARIMKFIGPVLQRKGVQITCSIPGSVRDREIGKDFSRMIIAVYMGIVMVLEDAPDGGYLIDTSIEAHGSGLCAKMSVKTGVDLTNHIYATDRKMLKNVFKMVEVVLCTKFGSTFNLESDRSGLHATLTF